MHRPARGALLMSGVWLTLSPCAARAQLLLGPLVAIDVQQAERPMLFGLDARVPIGVARLALVPRVLRASTTDTRTLQVDAMVAFEQVFPAEPRVTFQIGGGPTWRRVSTIAVTAFDGVLHGGPRVSDAAQSTTQTVRATGYVAEWSGGATFFAGARLTTRGLISPFATFSQSFGNDQPSLSLLALGLRMRLSD